MVRVRVDRRNLYFRLFDLCIINNNNNNTIYLLIFIYTITVYRTQSVTNSVHDVFYYGLLQVPSYMPVLPGLDEYETISANYRR